MDSETGEIYQDTETGEKELTKVNTETGETEMTVKPHQERSTKKFKIPNPQKPIKKEEKHKASTNTTSDTVQVILFLLPTVLLFFPVLAALISIVEIAVHVWAHKKNKILRNTNFYYQSPLHICVREFCGACRDEISANKISKIQDMRNDKFTKYVRRVVT